MASYEASARFLTGEDEEKYLSRQAFLEGILNRAAREEEQGERVGVAPPLFSKKIL